jgi:hypothetical protein
MVKFFDIKTGELFAEHEISCGFGNLVSLPRNAERFQNNKWEELKVEVLSGFSGCEGGEIFVCKIVEKYPRYIRDQLGIIKKQQEKFSKSELSAALNYCTEHELFSANDFRDTLEYFKATAPIEPIREVKLDIKYSVVTAQIRDLSAYTSIAKGD